MNAPHDAHPCCLADYERLAAQRLDAGAWAYFSGGAADVLKALATGATAVMIGRPIVYGLAVSGAMGVAHVLRLLRDEFEVAMALTGCATLADIGAHLLRR